MVIGLIVAAALAGSAERKRPVVTVRIPGADASALDHIDAASVQCGARDITHFVSATGTVTNRGTTAASYSLHVIMTRSSDGVRFADGSAFVSSLAPGQTAEWEALTFETADEPYVCAVQSVDRVPG